MIRKLGKACWVYRCSPCDYTSPASVDMFGAQEWQLRHNRAAAFAHIGQGIAAAMQPITDAFAGMARALQASQEQKQSDYALVPAPVRAKPIAQLACAHTVWDGPYKMTCGYLIVFGKCIRHGSGGPTFIVPSDSPALRKPRGEQDG